MVVLVLVAGCGSTDSRGLAPFEFSGASRTPRSLTRAEIDVAARKGLRYGEQLGSSAAYVAHGIGHTVVQVVAETETDSRAYVVDEDGNIDETQVFWARERAARILRFGRLSPTLFEKVAAMTPADTITVDVTVWTDLPEPQLPYDGKDKKVSIEEYKDWTRAHANAQVARIAAAKQRVLQVLLANGAIVRNNPHALPTIEAMVPVELLQSQELNAPDVVQIEETSTTPAHLLGYAGRASMNASAATGGLDGGICGGPCDGGGIDVGYWERDADLAPSGIARNNIRISSNTVTGYLNCPTPCNTDGDCVSVSVKKFCKAPTVGGAKICVQDHLSWTVASVGMNGSYAYDTVVPITDADPNASGTFASTGAWFTDKRFGNDNSQMGLDFLIAPPAATQPCQTANAPPTPYLNRSVDQTPNVTNFAGRAFGTFVTAASGNSESGPVTCARLKNGLCVGAFNYVNFSDQSTHRRMHNAGDVGSSFLNDTFFDASLERPHLLGPGGHEPTVSGLHLPAIDVAPGASLMRNADYSGPPAQIFGTSFSAPSVLSIAIQAHQFEGWFSSLAFPMVNKAVLMASTRDANVDGSVGKANVWSANAPSIDAEDGAGQIKIGTLKTILTNNTYFASDLADSNFVSCGAGCRKFVVASVPVPTARTMRAALAWQSCMVTEGSVPSLNNDLDLAFVCTGTSTNICAGTTISNTVTSELEMIERPICAGSTRGATATCSIEIRIKNGAQIQPCGSTTTERVGVAWRVE